MELSIIQKIIVWSLPVLFAITVHEVAHGWVASLYGDKTAKLAGRLTLNPVKHIDPLGTIVVPLLMLIGGGFIIGWAKPVPVDSRNMRNPRYGMVMVSIAGPLSNFIMAAIWAGIIKISVLLPSAYALPLSLMGKAGMMINAVLGVLNCLPVPPLDGGHALMYLLPGRISSKISRFENYGFIVLVILMMTGILSYVIGPFVYLFLNGLVSLFQLNMFF